MAVAKTAAAVVALGLMLGGCFSETYQRGYIVPEGALAQIPVGSTQEQVLIVLGTPSTVATVSGEAFYYISQRAERAIGFLPQQVVDQRVVAVYFDKNRRVERLANYGLKDGRVFDFVTRSTPTLRAGSRTCRSPYTGWSCSRGSVSSAKCPVPRRFSRGSIASATTRGSGVLLACA